MRYSDYLSQHSYLHMLARNIYLGKYPRLDKGLSEERYTEQLEKLKVSVETGKR